MSFYVIAFLLGVVSGLRSLTAPAAVAWAGYLGWLPLAGTPVGFLGTLPAAGILTVLALGELVGDKLPKAPSRKAPVPFGARLVMGALVGAAIGATENVLAGGLVAGVVGAGLGTLAGAQLRAMGARAMGRDLPAALMEDTVAVLGAILLVRSLG
jgi:uncharacterized membrane protein